MKPRLFTWKEADDLSKKIALASIGFGPETGKVTVDASEVLKVAERAAWKALEAANVIIK